MQIHIEQEEDQTASRGAIFPAAHLVVVCLTFCLVLSAHSALWITDVCRAVSCHSRLCLVWNSHSGPAKIYSY